MKITVKYEPMNGEAGDVVYDDVAWTATLPDGKVCPYAYVEGSNSFKVTVDGVDVTVTFDAPSRDVGHVTGFSTSTGLKGKATVVAAA
ncbi:MAG: hypothetical protein HXY28_02645 [Hydrogenophilaceae bacterium]|jgi:hypothetical protein|nr:hypothetical protein [Hydrogenophilaceae bacterium]